VHCQRFTGNARKRETKLPSISDCAEQVPMCLPMLHRGQKQPQCSIRRLLSADESLRDFVVSRVAKF
jgi:hypothetical protein